MKAVFDAADALWLSNEMENQLATYRKKVSEGLLVHEAVTFAKWLRGSRITRFLATVDPAAGERIEQLIRDLIQDASPWLNDSRIPVRVEDTRLERIEKQLEQLIIAAK